MCSAPLVRTSPRDRSGIWRPPPPPSSSPCPRGSPDSAVGSGELGYAAAPGTPGTRIQSRIPSTL